MPIINEIEVENCRHLKNDGIKKSICRSGGCTGTYKSCLCIGNEDCDFKQLQRMKAENQILRQTLKDKNFAAIVEENEKFKNFVKDLLFDVSCENWFERFVFSFNDWKKELIAENAELKNRLMILDEETVTVQITTEEFEEFKNLKNENARLKHKIETILKSKKNKHNADC